MHKTIWVLILFVALSLPNLIALWFDPTSTKLAGLLVPLLFFVGIAFFFSISKRILLLIFVPFLWLSYSDLSYLLQFNLQTTPGMVEAILHSDQQEIMEFANTLPKSIVFLGFAYLAVVVLLFIFAPNHKPIINRKKRIIALILILLPIFDLVGNGASSRSFPLGIAHSIYVYANDKVKLGKLAEERKNYDFGNVSTSKKSENYILVLGETSRRDYYSLHGYQRNTNPKLAAVQNLALFENAISPSNATIPSLKSILYMATTEDDSLFYTSASIIVLAKQAGFKTSWLSSQARYGKFDSMTGETGIAADKTVFINQSRSIERVYDEDLVPYLDENLRDGRDNKFIVLHLYGSHITYQRRYPERFTIFSGIPEGYKGRSKEIIDKVNTYTNSVLYTDYVLDMVIESTRSQDTPSCVVYTSDHGEYLGDEVGDDFTGHGYPLPHKVEVEVPLIVWCNDEYREQYPKKWAIIMKNTQAKISTEDMFFSMADLMSIDFDHQKKQRSFFGGSFQPILPRKVRSASNKKVFNYNEL